ncbi:MAG: UDP-N-acetylglucosamine 2-epimerase (non-hydrolyzing) [Planctomycetes bacterium]|nr:UDP-N-acetylglucosamine 2-epimerase (non-hydrolyzing) [Planctomycetota bacterium]MBI3835189.1 UDP-N-acetylglucosamine 2-epimerase (non-hydrolyzing) [Planctomycetota bacterium]
MLKILCVCGARPNFMKIAPLVDAISRTPGSKPYLVHTGQHYDDKMSHLFFEELRIPRPDVNLEVGSGSQAVQTAEIMKRFEPVCIDQKPDWVVVVGDVNSTIACALVAVKLGVKVAHVEAGLRSFDRAMPEEINRVLTDAISDLLFVSEPSGVENLRREGVAPERVHFVGNVMIDALLKCRDRAAKSTILNTLELRSKGYAAVTLHRPSNVDGKETFGPILAALETIAQNMPVVFPMHPRTRHSLGEMGLSRRLAECTNLKLIEPLGYLDFMKLMADASVVLTDSGGVQEETTILGVPCLTLRANTERPITITLGTNRLTGTTTDGILRGYHEATSGASRELRAPELWDGRAAERIVSVIEAFVATKS